MTEFGQDLIEAMKEALAHSRGEEVPGMRINHCPAPRDIRKHAGLTQAEMAPLMGMSLSGYRKWEQGRRTVSGPALNLLRVIEKNPAAVMEALRP